MNDKISNIRLTNKIITNLVAIFDLKLFTDPETASSTLRNSSFEESLSCSIRSRASNHQVSCGPLHLVNASQTFEIQEKHSIHMKRGKNKLKKGPP